MTIDYTIQDLVNDYVEDLNFRKASDLSWNFIIENNLDEKFKNDLYQKFTPEIASVKEFIQFINSDILIDKICYENINGVLGISLFSKTNGLNLVCFEKFEQQQMNPSGFTSFNMKKIPDTKEIYTEPLELYITIDLSYVFTDHKFYHEKPHPMFSSYSRLDSDNVIKRIVSQILEKIYGNSTAYFEIEKKIQNTRRPSQAIGDFYNKIFDLNLENFLINKDLLLIDTNNLEKELLEAISIHEITKDNYFDIVKEIQKIQNLIKDSNKLINDVSLSLSLKDINNYYDDFFKNNQ